MNTPFKENYIQYKITETNESAAIYIYTDRGAAIIANQFATAPEVASILNVSRSSAYRIMQRLARYEVEDMRHADELRTYSVVKREDVAAYQRASRGNPHFTDPTYQRRLAKRPRKKKVDN